MSAAALGPSGGRYDPQERRQSTRAGRERGCWVYIAAAELEAAGVPLAGPPPLYRVWGRPKGSVLVRLYKPREVTRA